MRAIDADRLLKMMSHWKPYMDMDKVRKAVQNMPTLTPPNEWVSRVLELDELYTKLQTVTGFTAEQLLEMFKAGYTLEKPDYSKHFEVMANLAESDPPNEPLTLEQLREMDGEPVWVKVFGPTNIRCDGWCEVEVRDKNTSDEIAYVWWAGSEVEDIGRTEDYGKTWITYRRAPGGGGGHMRTCHNCACDPVCDHNWNGWETCGNWIQKPGEPPTNADRIRAMSDEELLDFMKESVANAYMCKIMRTEPMFLTLEWLRQSAEEDT